MKGKYAHTGAVSYPMAWVKIKLEQKYDNYTAVWENKLWPKTLLSQKGRKTGADM